MVRSSVDVEDLGIPSSLAMSISRMGSRIESSSRTISARSADLTLADPASSGFVGSVGVEVIRAPPRSPRASYPCLLTRVDDPAGLDGQRRPQAARAVEVVPPGVVEDDRAVDHLERDEIRRRPDAQGADAVTVQAEHPGGVQRRPGDHLLEREPERDELRHDRWEIAD